MFHKCFKSVSKVLWEWFQSVCQSQCFKVVCSHWSHRSYPSIRRACFLIYQIILAFMWIKAQNKIQNRNFRRDFWERGFYERPLWYIAYSPWIWTKWSKTAQWMISTLTEYSQAWFLRKVPLEISERTFRSTCILFRGGVCYQQFIDFYSVLFCFVLAV